MKNRTQEHGIGMEEVGGQDRLGLRGQERPPGLPSSSGGGVDARVFEDRPHRGWRDFVTEAGQLTVDAAVSPARIVVRHL
jgi:hypothetical protein